MNTPKKETLYKTAYSPTYQSYVGLTSAWQDSRGEWIFRGYTITDYETRLFRKEELTNFVL